MYQHLYSQFLSARPSAQHFACHSHHYWPDVTREAMLEYWDDTAKYVDDKWTYIFENKLPETQRLVANALNISKKERIIFAPNTHELLYRIYSSFDCRKKISILTTDSEFYSFQRQVERWTQSDLVDVTVIPTEPFNSFEKRFIAASKQNTFDWIFCSHVFFNSGKAIQNLTNFVEQLPTESLITIDGYHGFFAIPTDLAKLEHKIFYLAGSYKYAQGGEGACFAVVPDGLYEPSYTGWFAEFGNLHQRKKGRVAYALDGQQFAGATMDYSPLYRLNAVLELFERESITVEDIHTHVKSCQFAFLQHLQQLEHKELNESNLMQDHLHDGIHGHFLTFKLPEQRVHNLAEHLKENDIHTDYRADRLRFGFALYHEPSNYNFTCLKA